MAAACGALQIFLPFCHLDCHDMLHGIGGDEKEWLNGGKPQVILDNLYAQGKLEPMIVVLPNGRAMKDDRATGKGRAHAFQG